MADLSIAEFVARLAEMTIATEHETRAALEEAALVVQIEAKEEIGHYQPEAGPFAAWAELADSTKADRLRQGYTENDPLLREGDLRDGIERTVQGHVAYVGSDSPIAEYQELGTSRIPPRSFLGGALVRKSHEVVEICSSHIVGALTGTRQQIQIPLGASDLTPSEGEQ